MKNAIRDIYRYPFILFSTGMIYFYIYTRKLHTNRSTHMSTIDYHDILKAKKKEFEINCIILIYY